jgi:hypothetical protein
MLRGSLQEKGLTQVHSSVFQQSTIPFVLPTNPDNLRTFIIIHLNIAENYAIWKKQER